VGCLEATFISSNTTSNRLILINKILSNISCYLCIAICASHNVNFQDTVLFHLKNKLFAER